MPEIKVRFSYALYNDLRRAAEEENKRVSEIIKRGIEIYCIRHDHTKEGSVLATVDAFQPQIYELVDTSYSENDIFDFNEGTVWLPTETYEDIRRVADEEGISPPDVIRKGLRLYLRIRTHQKNGKNLVSFEARTLTISGIAKDLKEESA